MVLFDCRFPSGRATPLRALALSLAMFAAVSLPSGAAESKEPQAFLQALAAAASDDTVIADWYRSNDYLTLWTGAEDAERRQALLAALATAADHGLPVARYDASGLRAAVEAAQTEGDRGRVEIALTRAYLNWAHDLTSGALEPAKVDAGILRDIAVIDPAVLLSRMATGEAQAVLDWLVPRSPAYLNLMKAKIRLEADIANGGWGAPGKPGPQSSNCATDWSAWGISRPVRRGSMTAQSDRLCWSSS
jgi:L,D-transpeptidase YcbB